MLNGVHDVPVGVRTTPDGDVTVEGDQAVAEVHEVGGTVPHLRLFLLKDRGSWRIEAVGAVLRSET